MYALKNPVGEVGPAGEGREYEKGKSGRSLGGCLQDTSLHMRFGVDTYAWFAKATAENEALS